MKRIGRLLFLLILLLFGCGPKEIVLDAPLAPGIGSGEPNNITITAGSTVSIPLTLPELKEDSQIEVFAQPPLSAEQKEDLLLISCGEPGRYPLTITLRAEGYRQLDVPCQVQVEPRPMKLAVLDEAGSPVQSVALARGETAVLTLAAEEGAVFSCSSAAEDSPCGLRLEGDRLTITADRPGECSVPLRAFLDGWADAEFLLPVAVSAVPAELSVPKDSLSGLVGETLTLPCVIDSEGVLSASCDPRLTASVSGGTVSFSAGQPGNYQVTLTVEAPGDLPSSKTVSVLYRLPSVSLSVPGSISLNAGESVSAQVTATPGASVWVSASEELSASISADGTLTVSADRKGSGTLTVGAQLDGYQSASAEIPVTVGTALPPASSRYADEAQEIARLVNEERAVNGLKALTYRPVLEGLAQARARESSEYWSHTRPDGRMFNSIFSDYGLHYQGEGENLFASNVLDTGLAMEEWMNSPDHRANILRSNIDGIAVGIVRSGDGDYYICQLFVTD